MSRIYDALRKAEEEKQNLGEATSSPATVATPSAPAPAIDALAEVRRSMITGAVSAINWNPNLKKLPALVGFDAGAEEFRRLRSRLYQFRDSQPIKSLLVTSGLPGEGKSFIASNLAISLARHQDCRVLLIDGDLRKPSLHTVLGAPSSPGLSDYLAGKTTAAQIVQRGNISNLSFIPAGTPVENAAELAGNYYIEELVRSLSNEFDWIVTDSSPVVPVSDAVNLARACDGVLLVARAAQTPFDIAQKAQKEFKNTRVIGFVLNAVPNMKSSSGYGYYNKKYGYSLTASSSAKAQAAGAE
ncbi:MAG: CpsD/CapB family tyrosine-protein kinase [Acidobacteriaceae bacterium]